MNVFKEIIFDEQLGDYIVNDQRNFSNCVEFQLKQVRETAKEKIIAVAPDYKQRNAALGLLSTEETDQLKNSINISDNNIKMIIRFILSNKKYYYPLTQIYKDMEKTKSIDCSGSIYINKCHLLFMENYINMSEYLIDFRRMVVI
jgi:hypothetical protein